MTETKRKIIQISATPDVVVPGDFWEGGKVIALCNDGTVWCLEMTSDKWIRLPNVPQGPISEDK